MTKPELSSCLMLSLPTIGQLIKELVAANLVEEDGIADSVGGRRAVYYSAVTEKKALGVDITQNHVSLALVDLAGKMIVHKRKKQVFQNSPEYNTRVNLEIQNFLQENNTLPEQLIGVGCALPGIVSKDRKSLRISHALKVTEDQPFFPEISLGCELLCFNDADAACMLECYADEEKESFVYLSLSNTVGGALIVNKSINRGILGRCGELGHVCIDPGEGARMCYCGKRGHYDAYGSAKLLAQKADNSLEKFFELVEQGEPEMVQALDEYLDYLALLVENIVMFLDMPVVVGGYVGNHLEPHMDKLRNKVSMRDNLGFSNAEHVFLCRKKMEAAAVGCALYFVENFIKGI